MAKSELNFFEKSIDFVTFSLMAFLGISFGMILIGSALEGAGLLPNLMLRPGVQYSAYQAVAQLLFGQLSLGCGVASAFFAWKGE